MWQRVLLSLVRDRYIDPEEFPECFEVLQTKLGFAGLMLSRIAGLDGKVK